MSKIRNLAEKWGKKKSELAVKGVSEVEKVLRQHVAVLRLTHNGFKLGLDTLVAKRPSIERLFYNVLGDMSARLNELANVLDEAMADPALRDQLAKLKNDFSEANKAMGGGSEKKKSIFSIFRKKSGEEEDETTPAL